jgi:hypothetical protein
MRWVMHVQRRDICTDFLWGEGKGVKRLLGRLRHRWEDSIQRDLKKTRSAWTGFIRFMKEIRGRLCQHSKETSGSIKMWETS